MTDSTEWGFATRAIHVGQEPDVLTGAVTTPIYQTSTFAQDGIGAHKGYEYGRTGNPTRTALERCLASLEEGSYGLAFSSGMGAVSAVAYLLKQGDHVVAHDDLYGGTARFFNKLLSNFGVETTFVDASDPAAVQAALRPTTRLVWLETPTNPLLGIVPIKAVSDLAHAHDPHLLVVVDNTFASSYFQRPLTLGADIVLHSATKYLGGHSDVVLGAIVVKDNALDERLRYIQNAAGATPGPFDAWLVLRGLKTLSLRMRRHEDNAMAIAVFLSMHPHVGKVSYPGLPSLPGHNLARQQMDGFGGMISADLHGGLEAAQRVLARTKLFTLAESLGGVESLIEHPGLMTHASLGPERREQIGLGDGLIRLSVGIEDEADLLADLAQALEG